jgi:glutamate--cysteine ligase
VRTEHDVIGFVTRTCFKTGPPGRVGIESEWFIHSQDTATGSPDLTHLQRLAERAGPLPGGSRITFEPGGQLELSTTCGDDLPHALSLLDGDLTHLDKLLRDDGLHRVGMGVDPVRRRARALRSPRYDAMERYLDTGGPAGRLMMTSTAAVQVCLDAGADATDVRRRWRLVHALTPVLVAAFANSPLLDGRPTGWASTRQHIWSQLDPTHTRPALADGIDADSDPARQWAHYALDARVMMVRTPDGPWESDPGMTLRDWVSGRTGRPSPTYDDVGYHLTTLFPPVRPHGWLELRMIDALPDELWPVAVAVAAALLDDAAAADRAADAVAGTERMHERAARAALRDRALQRAALECFAAAHEALPRLGADAALLRAVADYIDRYVCAGRTPADDLLDHTRRD